MLLIVFEYSFVLVSVIFKIVWIEMGYLVKSDLNKLLCVGYICLDFIYIWFV